MNAQRVLEDHRVPEDHLALVALRDPQVRLRCCCCAMDIARRVITCAFGCLVMIEVVLWINAIRQKVF